MNSAGNGAAMRAAPVGLARAFGLSANALRRDAVLAALPTHAHPVGVAGAVAIASGVAWCLRRRLDGALGPDVRAFAEFVRASVAEIERQPTPERRPGGAVVFLRERIAELPSLAQLAPEDAFARTWNGAFALESVPAALYCFLRSGGDPTVAILTAVNAGHDSGTVASMAGNLVGAWCGAERLRRDAPAWWSELEHRDELIDLADRLHDLAVTAVR